LEESSTEIQQCAEPVALQRALEARDERLLSLSEAVGKYVENAEKAQLQDKLRTVSEIAATYQPPSSSPSSSSLPSESIG
jgi:hypothetical protein